MREAQFFFEHGQFFFELENREAVLGLFFELFFEGHRKSLNIFLKACSKFYFWLVLRLGTLKNKEKQREKANKESNFSLGRLAAPENIDLWYFSMKIRIIFWTWAILFWTRKPRSGFRVFFWIIFWMPRSGNFFWTRAKSLKKHWSTRVPRLSLPAAEHSADVFKQ